MAQEEYRPPMKEFLDMLADLLAEKYFERMEERIKKIPELRRLITAKEASQYLSLSTDTVYRMDQIKYIKCSSSFGKPYPATINSSAFSILFKATRH
jgi:predicted DNA-binding transcriptional regulator AlpA